jgi:hypothetical protein
MNWWWRIDFGAPRQLGAILQIQGDHEFVLQHSPRKYVWQISNDGRVWRDLEGTRVENERRLWRIFRLTPGIVARFARLKIDATQGDFPALREVEFFESPRAVIPFPAWIVAVNSTHDSTLPGHGREFIPLAQSVCSALGAQQIWLPDFTPEFLAIEPQPLCGFLSGSFKDWCEVDREHWRGVERVLKSGRFPIWASCGGAQGLAILAENGVDQPWDCPHCRDALHPRLPIYTHIGHQHPAATHACGDYTDCVFERGPQGVKRLVADPVFAGLPEEFRVMESHCGQIEWAPKGWELIATAGPGTQTRVQCLRVTDRPIYAAQFHIEMEGTPETSRAIMKNFLECAASWRPRE